jgi:O-antigen ligase
MAVLSLGAVSLVLGFAVLRYGGVENEDWYLCLTALGLCGAAHWILSRNDERAPPLSVPVRTLLSGLVLVGLIQIVPLPGVLIRAGSPARIELQEAIAAFASGSEPLTFSIVPAVTFGLVLTLAGYVVLFLLIRDLSWRFRNRPWLIAAPFVAVAFLEGILGLLQVHLAGAPQASGTYVNRNHYAGLLELALPFPIMQAIALIQRSRKRYESPTGPAVLACLLLVTAAVILFACIQSLSRMGFLASLCALGAMGIVALGGGLAGYKRWIPIGGVLAAIGIAFIYLPSNQLIFRFANMAASEELSGDARAGIWRDSLKLIQAFPVLGCGLGCFESGFCRYQATAPTMTVDAAHNDYLQLLAELGLVGFPIIAVLAVRMFKNSFGGACRLAGNARYVAIACAGSLTAIAVHSLVDFNLYIPANGMLVVWIAALSEAVVFFHKLRRTVGGEQRARVRV